MKYLLDSEGYYLATVDSPTEGVEIDKRIVEIFRVAKQEGLMKIASTVRIQSRRSGRSSAP